MRGSQHGCASLIQGDHRTATLVFLNQNFQPWRALTGVSRRSRQAVSNMPELNARVEAVWNQLPEIYRRSQGLHQNHLRKYKAPTIQQQHQRFPIKIGNTSTEDPSVPVGPAKKVKPTDKCSPWRRGILTIITGTVGCTPLGNERCNNIAQILPSSGQLCTLKEQPAGRGRSEHLGP